MGLLSNRVNEGYLRMLGPLFTWKFLLMVSILTACIFIFRFFCRFLCPLGALYGLFIKISLVGVKVDHSSCTDCGLCVGKCKMDIKHVGDAECINCGECISACPTKAISWKGSKIFLAPNEIPDPAEDRAKAEETAKKIKKRNTIIKSIVAILLIAALCGTLVYYNFIDGRDTSPLVPPVESTETTSDDGTAETTDDQPPKAPVGTAIGNTCPEILVDLVGSDDKFNVQAINSEGRAVVLNFWYTTCGPCLEELPYFYEVANDYEDQIDVIAIHIDQPNVDVTDFIANDSGHPEWSDGTMLIGWDTNMRYVNMFNIQACPVTIVINADGVITDKFVGGLTQDELIAAVEKALAH